MKGYQISNKGTTRLFKSSLLESLTRTPFVFPVSLYYFIALVCLLYAALYTGVHMIRALYIFPLGMFSFTLIEYLIHRYIFHFNAVTEKEKKIKYSIHLVHHEFPRDKDRLAMPPVLSATVALAFFLLFKFLMDDYSLLFFAGFCSGYSNYLLVHYAIHRYRPPSNFLKYLWRHHSLHHYKNDDTAFGVTFPLWDFVFGTLPKRDVKAQERLPDNNLQ